MTRQLQPLVVKTITSDNGREFANHQQVTQQLSAAFYFAHPYSSWERGLNENTNGLVRQYFPKKHDFATITDKEISHLMQPRCSAPCMPRGCPITDKEISHLMQRLNNRPRKRLGYRTPNELFFKQPLVALTT